MNCEDFDLLIFDFTDGGTSAETRQAIDAHLRDCARCRQAAAQARLLDTSLSARLARPALSLSFERRLQERIAATARLEAEYQEGLQRLKKNYFGFGALAEYAGYAVAVAATVWLLWGACADTGNMQLGLMVFGGLSLALGAAVAFPSIRRGLGV
jgi:anti-sigma factor RsiW